MLLQLEMDKSSQLLLDEWRKFGLELKAKRTKSNGYDFKKKKLSINNQIML